MTALDIDKNRDVNRLYAEIDYMPSHYQSREKS